MWDRHLFPCWYLPCPRALDRDAFCRSSSLVLNLLEYQESVWTLVQFHMSSWKETRQRRYTSSKCRQDNTIPLPSVLPNADILQLPVCIQPCVQILEKWILRKERLLEPIDTIMKLYVQDSECNNYTDHRLKVQSSATTVWFGAAWGPYGLLKRHQVPIYSF